MKLLLVAALALPAADAPKTITLTEEQAEQIAQAIVFQQRQIADLRQAIYLWQLKVKDLESKRCT